MSRFEPMKEYRKRYDSVSHEIHGQGTDPDGIHKQDFRITTVKRCLRIAHFNCPTNPRACHPDGIRTVAAFFSDLPWEPSERTLFQYLAKEARPVKPGEAAQALAHIIQCAVERRCVSHRCKSCLRNCRCISVATEAAGRVTDPLKPSGQRPTVGGSASRRAATYVKPEQASKVKSRGPTGLNNREGRRSPWEQPTDDHGDARRGKGRGTPAQHTGQHGRSHAVRRRAPRSTFGVEPCGKSEGLIVPDGPAGRNRQGGKEPWFEACLTEFRVGRVA